MKNTDYLLQRLAWSRHRYIRQTDQALCLLSLNCQHDRRSTSGSIRTLVVIVGCCAYLKRVRKRKNVCKMSEKYWNIHISSDLLLEFHLVQETVLQYAHDINQANQQIRANIRLLTSNEFIQGRGNDIVRVLDWFEDLEKDVRPYALQHVLEGCVHLPTRRAIVQCLVRFNPLNIQTVCFMWL